MKTALAPMTSVMDPMIVAEDAEPCARWLSATCPTSPAVSAPGHALHLVHEVLLHLAAVARDPRGPASRSRGRQGERGPVRQARRQEQDAIAATLRPTRPRKVDDLAPGKRAAAGGCHEVLLVVTTGPSRVGAQGPVATVIAASGLTSAVPFSVRPAPAGRAPALHALARPHPQRAAVMALSTGP
jgi:hypothetical protein